MGLKLPSESLSVRHRLATAAGGNWLRFANTPSRPQQCQLLAGRGPLDHGAGIRHPAIRCCDILQLPRTCACQLYSAAPLSQRNAPRQFASATRTSRALRVRRPANPDSPARADSVGRDRSSTRIRTLPRHGGRPTLRCAVMYRRGISSAAFGDLEWRRDCGRRSTPVRHLDANSAPPSAELNMRFARLSPSHLPSSDDLLYLHHAGR